jgi:hypothetical protein
MRYLGRLDDVCSTMDAHKWTAIENILDIYQVKPMVGIVPANAVINYCKHCRSAHRKIA